MLQYIISIIIIIIIIIILIFIIQRVKLQRSEQQ